LKRFRAISSAWRRHWCLDLRSARAPEAVAARVAIRVVTRVCHSRGIIPTTWTF